MRRLQVGAFLLAVAAFVAAAFFIGNNTGLDLWRTGVAVLLVDVVLIMLWPASREGARAPAKP